MLCNVLWKINNLRQTLSYLSLSCIRIYTQKQPPEVLYKKVVLKNFEIFTGKHFFNKAASMNPFNYIKKRLQHRYFPANIDKFLRTSNLKNTCERLILFPILGKRTKTSTFICMFLSCHLRVSEGIFTL